MQRVEMMLNRWTSEYGDSVPIEVVRDYFNPTETSYLFTNYRYDPMLRKVVNKFTAKVQTRGYISMGNRRPVISLSRAEWILRTGGDIPWRVGRDEHGLWAKDSSDAEKRYAP